MRPCLSLILAISLAGCGSAQRNPAASGGSDEEGGTGGETTPTGGKTGTGGKVGTGGAGTGGSSGGSGGSSGGSGGSGTTDAGPPPGDGSAPADGSSGVGDGLGPTAPGQGPTALGKIVFSNDFEKDMAGMSRSPTNLPPERVTIVDDPLNMRGKVVKIVWQAGDNYRTSPGTQPRSWYSNAMGYQIKPGTKVSLAWGFMWTDVAMDAFFAQTIGPGPVWELRVRANGRFQILCNQCGGNTPDFMMLTPNRWYDFRVDMDWTGGGKVQFFVDGQLIHQSTMGGASANCHWDGGIYNTPGGTASNKTRTVFLSNLSVGER